MSRYDGESWLQGPERSEISPLFHRITGANVTAREPVEQFATLAQLRQSPLAQELASKKKASINRTAD